MDRGALDRNPAERVRALRTGPGHQPRPDAAIERFRETAPLDISRALDLALYNGQRQGDVLAMRWSHYRDGGLEVSQRKTGTRLWVPVHPHLTSILAETPRRATTILTTPTGRVWGTDHFRHAFRSAILAAGLDGLTFRGLRHTAGRLLAEAGCTDREIMAILGHQTAAMVGRYTKGAEQKRLATAAILKLPGGTKPDHLS